MTPLHFGDNANIGHIIKILEPKPIWQDSETLTLNHRKARMADVLEDAEIKLIPHLLLVKNTVSVLRDMSLLNY